MTMRITWGKVRPGSWNDHEQAYKSSVVASGIRIKGLQARWEGGVHLPMSRLPVLVQAPQPAAMGVAGISAVGVPGNPLSGWPAAS